MPEISLRKNAETKRYEAVLDDDVVGYIDYKVRGEVVHLPHTLVNPDQEGQGIGSRLAQSALEDIEQQERMVAPECPFIADWLQDKEQFHYLLAIDRSRAGGKLD